MALLTLDNASAEFPGKPVLQGVNLSLEPGSRFGLHGSNGSGKTTLLRCLVGLHPFSSGVLRFEDTAISTTADFKTLREKVGLLMQHPADMLFCPTIADDCRFGPENFGHNPAEIQERIPRILETLGIGHLANLPAWKLSGGQQQAAALAALLCCNPRVLLLDEPTTGLDMATMEKLERSLDGTDTALLVVSHDHDFLKRVCDSHHHLVNGELAAAPPGHH